MSQIKELCDNQVFITYRVQSERDKPRQMTSVTQKACVSPVTSSEPPGVLTI